MPEATRRNARLQIVANALQQAGDEVTNAKTVLPWLLGGLGAPGLFVAMLVPVRESGSMLPQASLVPIVTARVRRRGFWVAGALAQGAVAVGLGLTALTASGAVAGVLIVLLLAVLALSRSLCSLTGKDVLGRTVPKGDRGRITGTATAAGGLVALTLGLVLRWRGADLSTGTIAWLLVAGGATWAVAAAVFSRVDESVADTPDPADTDDDGWLAVAWYTFRGDRPFRRFVIVRALLLVSALSPPFLVAASQSGDAGGLAGLGGFVLASGVSALIGGRLFGAAADRSSRVLMAGCAAAASAVGLAMSAAIALGHTDAMLLAGAFFVLSVIHLGIRVGRKTYVVDLAEGDERTEYVAVSNTIMGAVLLVVGGITAGLATLGSAVALAFLGVIGLAGAVLGMRLPEVSRRASRG